MDDLADGADRSAFRRHHVRPEQLVGPILAFWKWWRGRRGDEEIQTPNGLRLVSVPDLFERHEEPAPVRASGRHRDRSSSLIDGQGQLNDAAVLHLVHHHGVGVTHDAPGEKLEDFAHRRRLGQVEAALRRELSKRSQIPRTFSRLCTCSVGWAPCDSQYSARSSSISTSDGSSSGWYFPMFSMNRPSRGLRESATTTR